MRYITIVLATAALAAVGSVPVAQASSLGRPCTTAPQSQWLPLDALKAKAEAQGYKVQKAKIEKACGEIYALDQNNTRTELFVDPTSGEIVAKD
ncbi:PepSY domain-containing protein [Microvirga sp. G4-2]|uniref:PepSY domain-containing protein n=1 Tax=Microvirga sp. G4-2 TaxID=3434467 RepID=UPI004043E0CE